MVELVKKEMPVPKGSCDGAVRWEIVTPGLSAEALRYLYDNGWGTVNLAMGDFVKGCKAFLATLESTTMKMVDKQLICIVCFTCLHDGMTFDVAWCEPDQSERWYPVTLRLLPAEQKHLQERGLGATAEWLGIEPTVRSSSGPWHVTSPEFSADEIVLFDPFLDTWQKRGTL